MWPEHEKKALECLHSRQIRRPKVTLRFPCQSVVSAMGKNKPKMAPFGLVFFKLELTIKIDSHEQNTFKLAPFTLGYG